MVAVKGLPVHRHSAGHILFPLESLSPSWLFWKSNSAKLQCCIWRDSTKPSLRFSWFCVFFVSKGNPFLLLFYSAVSGVVPCAGRTKSPVCHYSAGYILFHWAHPGYFENRIPLKLALVSECSLENYSVAYEETQWNRVFDFRDCFCVLEFKGKPFRLLFEIFW